MSEIKRWATEFLDAVDGQDVGFWMRSLARAILADTPPAKGVYFPDINLGSRPPNYMVDPDGTTKELGAGASPASQERDDLERIAEMADVSPAHCGDPEVLKVLHGIRDELRALARLRSGTEPGDVEVNPYRNGWTGEAAARPSGGDGAKWGGPNPPHLIDDDPELNGEPHEPDCPQATPYEVGSGEPWECTCGGEGAPEPDGATLIARERLRQLEKWDARHDAGHRYGELAKVAAVLAVYGTDAVVHDQADFVAGTLDPWGLIESNRPDRVRILTIAGALLSAEIDRLQGTSPIDRLPPEREVEAREPDAYVEARLWADFKRGGFIAPHGGPPLDRARRDDFENDNLPVFVGTPGPDREAEIRADERRKVLDEARSALSFIPVHGGEQRRLMATADQQLARLSPTDEQESPNRSDEP